MCVYRLWMFEKCRTRNFFFCCLRNDVAHGRVCMKRPGKVERWTENQFLIGLFTNDNNRRTNVIVIPAEKFRFWDGNLWETIFAGPIQIANSRIFRAMNGNLDWKIQWAPLHSGLSAETKWMPPAFCVSKPVHGFSPQFSPDEFLKENCSIFTWSIADQRFVDSLPKCTKSLEFHKKTPFNWRMTQMKFDWNFLKKFYFCGSFHLAVMMNDDCSHWTTSALRRCQTQYGICCDGRQNRKFFR